MKYTRNGTNDAASRACETEPKPRVRMSSQLVLERGSGLICPAGSVEPSDSARCRTWVISWRMVCVYLDKSWKKIMAWFEDKYTRPVIMVKSKITATAAAKPRGR